MNYLLRLALNHNPLPPSELGLQAGTTKHLALLLLGGGGCLFVCFYTRSHSVSQAGLKLLCSTDSPTSAFQAGGTKAYTTRPSKLYCSATQ
jgi:hypothetical protein